MVDLLCIFSEHRHNRSKTEALPATKDSVRWSLDGRTNGGGCFRITFGWRGVRRFGTPNLRHAPALNWKCELCISAVVSDL